MVIGAFLAFAALVTTVNVFAGIANASDTADTEKDVTQVATAINATCGESVEESVAFQLGSKEMELEGNKIRVREPEADEYEIVRKVGCSIDEETVLNENKDLTGPSGQVTPKFQTVNEDEYTVSWGSPKYR